MFFILLILERYMRLERKVPEIIFLETMNYQQHARFSHATPYHKCTKSPYNNGESQRLDVPKYHQIVFERIKHEDEKVGIFRNAHCEHAPEHHSVPTGGHKPGDGGRPAPRG